MAWVMCMSLRARMALNVARLMGKFQRRDERGRDPGLGRVGGVVLARAVYVCTVAESLMARSQRRDQVGRAGTLPLLARQPVHVAHRRLHTAMTQQSLQLMHGQALLEHVRRIGMAQAVDTAGALDTRLSLGLAIRLLHGGVRSGDDPEASLRAQAMRSISSGPSLAGELTLLLTG